MTIATRHSVCFFAAVALGTVLAACGGPPPLSTVPGPPTWLRFDPPGGESQPTTVALRAQGIPPLACEMPCGMTAPSGTHLVSVTGAYTFTAVVRVPDRPSVGRLRFGNHGLRTAGNVFMGIGGVAASVGFAMMPLNVGWGVELAVAGIAVITLVPGLIMTSAAGSDGVEFEPWAVGAQARAAQRRIAAAPSPPDGASAANGMLLAPALQF